MATSLSMRRAYSAAYWSFVCLAAVINFFIAVAIFVITLPFDRNGRLLHLFACLWGQLYVYVNPFWHQRFEGRSRLPWKGPAVLVSNHQSLGDIPVLFGLYRPFKWVSKRANFRLPFLGWNMWLNRYVGLERGNKESIVKMMADCERWLDRGVPVLIFPEGTRSPDGEVKAFKDGAFQLAIKKACPLIPIAITGTASTLPKHGLVFDTSANILVRVLEPVDPKQFNGDVQALKNHVHAILTHAVSNSVTARAA